MMACYRTNSLPAQCSRIFCDVVFETRIEYELSGNDLS